MHKQCGESMLFIIDVYLSINQRALINNTPAYYHIHLNQKYIFAVEIMLYDILVWRPMAT